MFSAGWNPESRYDHAIEWVEPQSGERLVVVRDDSKSILNKNNSPDMPFSWSANPYRGCFHGCAYCYARPTHEYLGWGAGTDFERKLLVKPQAAELLEQHFGRTSWTGEVLLLSGNTDCYQPLERQWKLTRAMLEVCLRYRQPVAIITRSSLIARDAQLLAQLNELSAVRVTFSLPILDRTLCRALEPHAPPPGRRLEAMRVLADAGVPVGVNIAPCIPGITDRQLPAILKATHDAGARWANLIPLWLPAGTAEVFVRRLKQALPLQAEAILRRQLEQRGGRVTEDARQRRIDAVGAHWPMTRRLFEVHAEKLGFEAPPPWPEPSAFQRPNTQLRLF